MEGPALLALGLAAFAGALVQAATGFGFAILAAPVFLFVIGTTAAIPVLVALHVLQSAIIVPGVWRRASRWHIKRLLLGALLGCPLGLWLFQGFAVRGLKLTVGLLILGSIKRRLKGLSVMARRLASGDLLVRSQPGPMDEIGSVAASLNAMATKLHTFTTDLEAA